MIYLIQDLGCRYQHIEKYPTKAGMRKSKLRWWNAPQYRNMVNGFLGFVTARLLLFLYDLAGGPQGFRPYFVSVTVLLIGIVIVFRFYRLKRMISRH